MNNQTILQFCEVMREHAINELPNSMQHEQSLIRQIKFEVNNNLTSCAGRAYKRKGIVQISGIVHFKTPIIAQLVDTILHEIAHMIVEDSGHGYEWQKMAELIGCSAERTHMMPKAKRKSELELELADLDFAL